MYKDFLVIRAYAVQYGCNRTCTRTRTAGKGFAAAPFPYTHFKGMAVDYLNKFGIDTVGEYLVILEESACPFKVETVCIICEDNRMRISH